MGAVRSKVRVTAPAQGAADVTVYRADGSTEALSYTTETGAVAHSFPVTVAAEASTDFWMQNGDYVVSTVISTVEMAGGYGQTRALRVEADGWILRPDAPGGSGGGGDLDDLGDVDMTGKVVGSVPSWDGSEYVPAPPAVLSDDDPLPGGTASPGTSDEASRADHVHSQALPRQIPVDLFGTPHAVSTTAWSVAVSATSFFNGRLQVPTNTDLLSITFRQTIPAGTYTLDCFVNKNTNQPMFDVAVSPDGTTWTDIATGIDTYAAAPAAAVMSTTGIVIASEMSYVRIGTNGKNASSTAFWLSLSRLLFSRTS